MLTVLVILAVLAVLFVAAVVATREEELLVDAPADRADVELPAGRVVAEDLRSVRFGMVLRGYRMSEVDDVIDRLAGELAERDERLADLERALVEVVEPVLQEAEARQAAPVEAAEPVPVDEAPEPVLPPSPAPPLARGARDGEAPPEAPASDAVDLTPAEVEPAPEHSQPAPLDLGWQPTTVERTLDLAASYRFSMPAGTPVLPPEDVAEPEPEPEPPVVVPLGAETAPPTEDDLGFPEVEPAEPAAAWAQEAREDTGDDDRPVPRPPQEP